MGSGVRGGGVGDRLQRERVEEEEEGKRVVRQERDNQMPDEVMLRSVTAPFAALRQDVFLYQPADCAGPWPPFAYFTPSENIRCLTFSFIKPKTASLGVNAFFGELLMSACSASASVSIKLP